MKIHETITVADIIKNWNFSMNPEVPLENYPELPRQKELSNKDLNAKMLEVAPQDA